MDPQEIDRMAQQYVLRMADRIDSDDWEDLQPEQRDHELNAIEHELVKQLLSGTFESA